MRGAPAEIFAVAMRGDRLTLRILGKGIHGLMRRCGKTR